jgi:peptide/nickel transport system substrate-binding protein
MKNLITFTWTLVVCLALFNCGDGQFGGIDYDNVKDTTLVAGDWAVVHELSDPDILNPILSRGASSGYILGHIFESLMDLDRKTLEMRPYLATEKPVISPDKKKYTFTLRRDARFSDGKQVTAWDVLFSVKAIKNPFVDDAPLRGYYSSLKDVIVPDSFTVSFICEKPYFKNDEFLGGLTVMPKHIYDPQNLTDHFNIKDLSDPKKVKKNKKIEEFGLAFNKAPVNRAPIGSGPFVFDKWEANQQVVVKRNESWWRKGDPESPNYLDKIIHRTTNDMEAALVALKNEDFDLMGLKPNQYTQQTGSRKFTSRFRKTTNITPGYTYIGWNQLRPYFADKRVRWALSHLVDVDKIIKVVIKGFAARTTGPVFYQKKAYNKNLKPVPYDPARAKELLDESGWIDHDGDGVREKELQGQPVPFSFTFLINSGNDMRKQMALIITEELRQYGIKVEVRELEWAVFLDNIDTHNYDATILGWAMSIMKDDPFQLWHSSQSKNKGSNFISFSHPRVDEIIMENRVNFDEEKRIRLMMEFQEIIYNEQPYTFLYSSQALLAIHKRFRNVTLYPMRPGYDLHEWGVPKSIQKYIQ